MFTKSEKSGWNIRMKSSSCLPLSPGQDDLAAVARQHHVEAFLKILPAEAMRHDRGNIEPRLQHHGHVIPRLVHLAAIDALEGEHVEDDEVPVDGDFAVGDAEDRYFSAVGHVRKHVAEGVAIAGHL